MAEGDAIFTIVDAVELHKGRSEAYDRETGKWTCSRQFLIPWRYRFRFASDVCGYAKAYPGGVIYRGAPHQYPGLNVPCLAKTISIAPVGASFDGGYNGQEIAFYWAIASVGYVTPDYKQQENNNDAYFSEDYNGSAQLVAMPKGTFTFASGNTFEENLGKQMGSQEISFKIFQWPGFQPSTLNSYYGKMNTNTFRGMPAKKVLFLTSQSSRSYTPDGVEAFEVTLKFLYRDKEWNKMINPKNGNWETLTPSPYDDTDFSTLFPFLS